MGGDAFVHLLLEVECDGNDFADYDELDLRERLIEAIESRGVGEVGGFGSGMGEFDISVLVRDEAVGRFHLDGVLREFAPEAKYSIRVLPAEDE
jgi:hypothetical protein